MHPGAVEGGPTDPEVWTCPTRTVEGGETPDSTLKRTLLLNDSLTSKTLNLNFRSVLRLRYSIYKNVKFFTSKK